MVFSLRQLPRKAVSLSRLPVFAASAAAIDGTEHSRTATSFRVPSCCNIVCRSTSTRIAGNTSSSSSSSYNNNNNNNNDHNNNNILPDVTAAIGNTPLVDLSRIARHYGILEEENDGKILGKLEYLNPGGSKKDRIAVSILEEARKDGSLLPGQTVVELTSGNTGTGLAIACSVMGHPFVAVMSRGNSRERFRMMEALGATVVLVDTIGGTGDAPGGDETMGGGVSGADLDRVETRARELASSLGAFRVDQFVREANRTAHFEGTGPELWADSGGCVTDFCDFVGTGGSLGGIAGFLKEASGGRVRCYAVEPSGAPVLRREREQQRQQQRQQQRRQNDTTHMDDDESEDGKDNDDWVIGSGHHRIQGGGYMKSRNELPLIAPMGTDPGTTTKHSGNDDDDNDDDNSPNHNPLDRHGFDHKNELIDGYLTVSDEDAIRAARDLAKHEGIFAGYSAGANFVAAVEILRSRARARRRKNNDETQEQEHQTQEPRRKPPGEQRKPDVVAILLCDSGLKYMSTDLWE